MNLPVDIIDNIFTGDSCTFHLPKGDHFTNEQINFLNQRYEGKEYHFCCGHGNKYNGIMCDNNKNSDIDNEKLLNNNID